MTTSTQNITGSSTDYTKSSQTSTPIQQAQLLSAFGGAENAYGLSAAEIPQLASEFGLIGNTGNNQASTGTGALSSGTNTLENFAPTVGSTAARYMAGFNPTAVTNAQTQGALDEANKVAMPAIASNAATTGNINSTGTGVAEGIVKNSLADQWAQLYGQNANNAWTTALGNATTGTLGSAADLNATGNAAINSGVQTGVSGAGGQVQAPYTSVAQLLDLLGINAGGNVSSTGQSNNYYQQQTATTPSAMQVIGSLLGAGGSALGGFNPTTGASSGILGGLSFLMPA